MADTTTPKLGMIKPEVGASNNTWGVKTNGNWDIIESKMVRQSIQWTITTGDDNPVSTGGPFLVTRYGNDGLRIDDPININRQTGNVNIAKSLTVSGGSAGAPSISFTGALGLGFYAVDFASAPQQFGIAGRLVGDGTVPAGAIMDFATGGPPAGWLTCDGQAVSRTTYAQLFAVIGGIWGAGDGSTTFNLPNFLSRYRRHRDNSTLAGGIGTLQNPINLTHSHRILLQSAAGARTGANDRVLNHQHSGTSSYSIDSTNHSHGYTDASVAGGQKPNGLGTSPFASTQGGTTSANNIDAHRHTMTTDVNQGGVDHLHYLDLDFTSQGGSADGNEVRPYSATVLTCIKT